MTAQLERKLRVAQWATGTVGAYSLRAIIQHPDLELVGVRVYNPKKVGLDAGALCGVAPVGVKACGSIEDILAAKPDCVVYMPVATDLDDVCRLLESGIDIVSTRAEFFSTKAMAPEVWRRVETACRKGGSSIHATGSSPGFITEALPLVISSLSRRLDFLAIDEFANCLEGASEDMLTTLMGFGDTPEAFAKRDVAARDEVFKHSLDVLADALGVSIDRYEVASEVALCSEATKLQTVTIPAGSVGGQRVSITGLRGGAPLLRFRSNWFVTTKLDPVWDLRGDGWRVVLDGDTPLDITIGLPMPKEEGMLASARYTAHRPVNAIPYVFAARPGLVTTVDLPQVIARL